MAISSKFFKEISNLKLFKKALKKYETSDIELGVYGRDANIDRGGINQAGLAAVHEFGTDTIPARPFLRPVVQEKRYRQEYLKIFQKNGDVLNPKKMEQLTGLAGEKAVSIAQKRISDGLSPELKPETIARKGSSKPLIDTGRLRQSISWRKAEK